MTEYLTTEDLLALVDDLGVGPVRDVGLLDSSAHRPRTVLWGDEVYPTLDEKVAVLMESVLRNHALVDGNKRLAWLAAIVFYGLNAVTLDAPDDDAFTLVVDAAAGAVGHTEIREKLAAWR